MTQIPNSGDRVRITGAMHDPAPLEIGEEGTVTAVAPHSWGTQIFVAWDSGRHLILVQTDPFDVL
ncbi:DUF4314 domain-containing protein [Nocardia sp. alder85J]|uniref:DUF4314 domain-containing protein n=1 Tax=Nocardia sp. alder85J TaxID=2862949 RepID=UPI001CD75D4D|nr:DUF4314 domain-containing protein [Nocardia sp. alder85J]MCX4094534.1 DUF4314 domain-containing protein [Nocardia sp. alder85J]